VTGLPWPRMQGTVVEFQDAQGYGTIASADGASYFFHCTQITDGTRAIAVGASVMFGVKPWHRGQLEATGITPL
jgi:cold shock CspA family protein